MFVCLDRRRRSTSRLAIQVTKRQLIPKPHVCACVCVCAPWRSGPGLLLCGLLCVCVVCSVVVFMYGWYPFSKQTHGRTQARRTHTHNQRMASFLLFVSIHVFSTTAATRCGGDSIVPVPVCGSICFFVFLLCCERVTRRASHWACGLCNH